MRLRDIIIYVAGPYRADSAWQIEQNIHEAEKYALMLWRAGFTAICPHKNTAHFGGAHGMSDDVWLDGCLVLCLNSHAVLLLPRWLDSEGTKEEKAAAEAAGIPVFHSTSDFANEIKRYFSEHPELFPRQKEP